MWRFRRHDGVLWLCRNSLDRQPRDPEAIQLITAPPIEQVALLLSHPHMTPSGAPDKERQPEEFAASLSRTGGN